MEKPLSLDAIIAALAVLSVSAGCAKSEHAAPAPETSAAVIAPNVVPAAAPAALAAPATTAVDAGVEAPAPSGSAVKRGNSAACGAGACSPEMRKGK